MNISNAEQEKIFLHVETNLRNAVQDVNNPFGLSLNEQQIHALLEYLVLLYKWNKAYNLTAIRQPQEMLIKHIFDSLVALKHIPEHKVIDIGSGGGLPGIPLAICYPEKTITLLDSNSKKTRFLFHAKNNLGLDNVHVVHSRVEDHQQQYDAIISRAFSSLAQMLTWCQQLAHDQTRFYAMKGSYPTQELALIPQGFVLQESIVLSVPDLAAERHLLIFKG